MGKHCNRLAFAGEPVKFIDFVKRCKSTTKFHAIYPIL